MHPGEIGLQQHDSGVVVVSLTGEHDLTTAPKLRENLDEAVAGAPAVLIDLSSAEFIDSSIIGVVLEARRHAEEAGVGFEAALEGGDPAVRRVLEVTGLDKNLPVHDSLEAARSRAQAPTETKAHE